MTHTIEHGRIITPNVSRTLSDQQYYFKSTVESRHTASGILTVICYFVL